MTFPRFTRAALASLGAATLAACGGGGSTPSPDASSAADELAVVQSAERLAGSEGRPGACLGSDRIGFAVCRIAAAAGGSVAIGKDAELHIPAGALSADAVVLLREQRVGLPAAGANQLARSGAYSTSFFPLGRNAVTLTAPATLALRASAAPTHPQLGEVARTEGQAWERLPANFYRAADRQVLALTTRTNETYRVMFRSLRTESGPAVARGFGVFMDETFGNDAFFGAGLGLHEVLNNVAPVDAVALGAQVDLAKVPAPIVAAMLDNTPAGLSTKMAALTDPATTRALIKAGAVVGVKGIYADPASDRMTSVGLTCALCHQNVKPSTFTLKDASGAAVQAALPIGPLSVDGQPNTKLDAGKILSLTPGAQALGLSPTLASWGPNRFDVRAVNAFDDGANNPTDTPPLWNFSDLDAQGYPFGWDGLFVGPNALASQAEAVYHIVMGGKGAFGTANGALPPALRVVPPQALLDKLAAAATPAGQIQVNKDKLLDLQAWMKSIASPAPGAFDAAQAEAGWRLFNGKGACSSCHSTPELSGTKAGPFLANITAVPASGDLAGGIKVPGLRGVAQSGPYFHDDSVATLPGAVGRVADVLKELGVVDLNATERAQLVEYLKSL
ncbi:cytochrome c peroxidase [Burkholderiales bacterium JOSHI_001]|nr:cytochrome c peroxidase [Burkholderiales bacterium JOSHI_001]